MLLYFMITFLLPKLLWLLLIHGANVLILRFLALRFRLLWTATYFLGFLCQIIVSKCWLARLKMILLPKSSFSSKIDRGRAKVLNSVFVLSRLNFKGRRVENLHMKDYGHPLLICSAIYFRFCARCIQKIRNNKKLGLICLIPVIMTQIK